MSIAPIGHANIQVLHPIQFSSFIFIVFPTLTIPPFGHAFAQGAS
ncbi:hypothetical protein QK1_3534 [Clostridioides difficile DA00142]|nr:hypothetical protein QK1_3534 [Clostridioides difficile DA00142]